MRSPIVARRTLLHGAGIAVAFPFFESLQRHAQAQAAPKRFVCFYQCNGVNMGEFFPAAGGALTAASLAGSSLEPIASFADRTLIVRGLTQSPPGGDSIGTPGDDHQKGMGHKLTGAPLQDTQDLYASGPSLDQVIARSINPGGSPAMTLRVGRHGMRANGFISYSAAGTPVVGDNNPWEVYRRLMGVAPGSMANDQLLTRRKSVLDLIKQDLDELKAKDLGARDREKLDLHATSIFEAERRLMGSGLPVGQGLSPEKIQELQTIDPDSVTLESEYKRMGQLLMDVLALALAGDVTRVATLQWASGGSGPVFRWDGMDHKYDQHLLSHGETCDDDGCDRQAVDGYESMLADIDRWHMTQLRYLLDRMAEYGDLLDNSALLYINELSNGKAHDWHDVPAVVIGSAGGYLKSGQMIDTSGAPHNQLLTTLCNAVGARTESGAAFTHFGDQNYGKPGELSQIVI
jgi:hypothetical protein